MDEDVAKLVIAAGFFVGLVFWLIALQLYRKIAGADARQRFEARMRGLAPVDAINQLIADGRLISPQARVSRPAENRLTISQSGLDVNFEAARAGGGTVIEAEIDDAGRTRKFQLGLGVFVLILMPIVIGGVPVALWHFAAPSPNAGARWQSVQVVQIVHVLWPPFAIYFAWKRLRTQAANAVSNQLVSAQAAAGRAAQVS